MYRRPCNPLGPRLFQYLVIPGYFIVWVQEQMAMPFYQSWQDRLPFQIQHDDSCRCFYTARGANGFDDPVVDQHLPAFMHLFPIKDPVRPKEIESVGLGKNKLTKPQQEEEREKMFSHLNILFECYPISSAMIR
jgi:hypothetical protein